MLDLPHRPAAVLAACRAVVMDTLERSFEAFAREWPTYSETRALDELRAREFARLDEQRHVYLDYTGAGLYGASQVRQHMALLLNTVLGNPHSVNPTSMAATELVETCRDRVLSFFGASRDEYQVIFTANASHALKLVGESYPFAPGGTFLLTFDNHNSVNGIREYARARGAAVIYVPVVPPDMRVDSNRLARYLATPPQGVPRLFAYPAQSNFSGVQHPLEWVEQAHQHGWDVLLDAAAFVPTNRLALTDTKPEFVALSFYKMFGYPTGVGALLAKWSALAKLRRPWFAGGTITVASVTADRHYLAEGAAAFEDGTVNYTALPAVPIGLDFLEAAGIDRIHERVRCLAGWLIDTLMSLRHGNGSPLISLYGPATTIGRGGTVTMNFQDAQGRFIDHRTIEQRAAERGISLRTGCFCNPGAGEVALGLSPTELTTCFAQAPDRMTLDDFRRCIDGRSTGAVRVSLGLASNFADVHAFAAFAAEFLEPR